MYAYMYNQLSIFYRKAIWRPYIMWVPLLHIEYKK